jgi:hypothetical protein
MADNSFNILLIVDFRQEGEQILGKKDKFGKEVGQARF